MAKRKRADKDAELIESKKWGVPNWKNEDEYPKNWNKLSPDKRKWEFLRRTKEYREDWELAESAKNIPIDNTSKSGKVLRNRVSDKDRLASRYKLSHPIPPQHNYKMLPNDFSFHREPIAGGDIVYPRFPPIVKNSPSTIEEKLALCAYKSVVISPPRDWYELCAWVEFDLSHSLDEQIKSAKKNLIAAQKEAKIFMESLKNEEDSYDMDDYAPLEVGIRKKRIVNAKGFDKEAKQPSDEIPSLSLLRILDAKNCNCTNEEIALNLYTQKDIEPSTISKRHKVALQLWKRL